MAKYQGPFYTQLGENIRKAREQKKKLTQEKLARAVALTRTSITNIEKGRQPVLAHVLAQIAAVLNVNVQDLLPSTDTPVPTNKTKSKLRKLADPQREWVNRVMTTQTPQEKD